MSGTDAGSAKLTGAKSNARKSGARDQLEANLTSPEPKLRKIDAGDQLAATSPEAFSADRAPESPGSAIKTTKEEFDRKLAERRARFL